MIGPTQQKLDPTRAGFSPDDLPSLLVAVPLQVVSPPPRWSSSSTVSPRHQHT